MAAYYMGRIDGVAPDTDLATSVHQFVKNATPAELNATTDECLAEFDAMGKRMLEMTRNLASRVPK